jgi:site-specific recombinase
MATLCDLPELITALDPDAQAVQRHLWLVALFEWIRGDCSSVPASLARVQLLMDAFQIRLEARERLQVWWQKLLLTLDGTALLADYGFSSNSAFVSELVGRILKKILPGTPETADASVLFSLVLCHRFDAQWLSALDAPLLARIGDLLQPDQGPGHGSPWLATHPWQATLLEAVTFCTSQVRATGFSPELRLRMSSPAREASPFHALARDFDGLREAYLASPAQEGAPRQAALHQFRERLDACRQAAATVYTHLDAHGISVDLVFQLRQLRERVLRIRALLDCLFTDHPTQSTARLLAHLVIVGQERRSVRVLIAANTSLLAAKVADRSSETGEHYITRTLPEYRNMVRQAAGGGAVTALTTWMKFGVVALGFSVFWSGFWAGAGYALSFVVIQLLHFTLATKQPAMTAPAMAAKLKDLSEPSALEDFADEVTHLVRSQVAAVLGNVLLVFPVVVLISVILRWATGHPMVDAANADYVLKSLTLLGPTALFAAFTGVLLFVSSIVAGWVENWFVLHRLDSALRYNPKITAWLGVARADRWATFMRANISGFAANISLGFMLGLIPAFADFFGVGVEVRHVTLSAGQLGAACASLGWGVLREPALWWCVLALPVMGAMNLGVSFYLAFSLALKSHNVTVLGRARISAVIWRRWRETPLSFFWPMPVSAVVPTTDVEANGRV